MLGAAALSRSEYGRQEMRRWTLAALLVSLAVAAPAASQSPPLHLAAPADCMQNAGCGQGLRSTYKLDVNSLLVPLTVADAGVNALDDGRGDVAVAFSSNPQISRPDIVSLRDDRHMIGPENVQISIRKTVLRRGYGAELRRRLNAATRVLTTLQLRGLNQQVTDGRLPEAVGAEFAESHGLVRSRPTRKGKRVVIGHFDFEEATVLGFYFAEVLRGDGFRVTVRSVGGLRPQASKELRTGKIDLYQGYLTSGLKFLRPNASKAGNELGQLRSALGKLGATSLTPAPAENKNVFVMKGDRARELGISKLSDLARYWPAAG